MGSRKCGFTEAVAPSVEKAYKNSLLEQAREASGSKRDRLANAAQFGHPYGLHRCDEAVSNQKMEEARRQEMDRGRAKSGNRAYRPRLSSDEELRQKVCKKHICTFCKRPFTKK